MTAAYLRAVRLVVLGATLLPLVVTLCSRALPGNRGYRITAAEVAIHLVMAAAINVAAHVVSRRSAAAIDDGARGQATFLDRVPARWAGLAIASSAALSLFLELAVIRWQGSVFELFALYKNLGLLACFAGLGLGYALASRDRVPLLWTIPLLGAQVLLLLGLRYGLPGPVEAANGLSWRIQSLLATPFPEQRNMGLGVAESPAQFVAAYTFLAVVFPLTALAFLPLGQLCGRLMQGRPPLAAYASNLVGSLAGTAFLLAASALWSPPVAWFAAGFGALLAFQAFERRALLVSAVAGVATLVALAWPVSFLWERIYSPYQLIERGPGEHGLMMICSAGQYYQRVHDLSPPAQERSADRRHKAFYYELPYRIHGNPGQLAVLGAGSGNDVAAALRAGARRVYAVEIDPVILQLGAAYHPEQPYSDPRVVPIVDDARAFLRSTPQRFDLVVYALLDSHTLLSHASSVRLESFVYTVEGIREARARLEDDGLLSLSFAVVSDEIGRKIHLMMTEAFDGVPPLCLRGQYEGAAIFVQKKHGGLSAPAGAVIDARHGVVVVDRYADPALAAEASSDDWPFLYIAHRRYPLSSVAMGALVFGLTALLLRAFTGTSPAWSGLPFFLTGTGFMLVETKAITELGLTFGNTWQVVGISISGILVMAFLATVAVRARPGGTDVVFPSLLLLASLAAGWWVSGAGGFAPTAGGKAVAVALLSVPVFFSGIVFARLLAREVNVAGAMAANLMGAMLGGLLEYNAMYFGFRFLYVLAGVPYLLVLILGSGNLRRRSP
jgi:hypothetical protein